MLRYVTGYALDFFRERVTRDDFRSERIGRILVAPGYSNAMLAAVLHMFPQSEVRTFPERTSLQALRRIRFDAACIPMQGGSSRARLMALLSGARHKLLFPSPDYVYRLGIRSGWAAIYWGVVDRFLLAPLALLKLAAVGIAMYLSGLILRTVSAEQGIETWKVKRLLVIRLMPARSFTSMAVRLRQRLPGAQITALIASPEGSDELAAVSDSVIMAGQNSLLDLFGQLIRGHFDLVLLAGGADYGLAPTYLKAVLLAWICSFSARQYQWEIGDTLPGVPLSRQVLHATGLAIKHESAKIPAVIFKPLYKMRLRKHYQEEPRRGPSIVQIGITKACNYHCRFCPFHNPQVDAEHNESQQPRMSYEMFTRLVTELRHMGVRGLDICGDGEPLTHPEVMEMLALARGLGFEVTLATNGDLLTEKRSRLLVNLGVRRMHISLNAATETTYSQLHPGARPGALGMIVERLRGMAEYVEMEGKRSIEIEVSAVLTRANMAEIEEMVEIAHRARADWFMLILMGPVEPERELLPRPEDWPSIQEHIERAAARARELRIRTNLDTIRPGASSEGTRRIYERIPCYAGHEYALVLADGSVLFCCQCTQPLGNLHQDSFRTIWNSDTYRAARRRARELPRSRQALRGCECFDACSHVQLNFEVFRKLQGEQALS